MGLAAELKGSPSHGKQRVLPAARQRTAKVRVESRRSTAFLVGAGTAAELWSRRVRKKRRTESETGPAGGRGRGSSVESSVWRVHEDVSGRESEAGLLSPENGSAGQHSRSRKIINNSEGRRAASGGTPRQ